MGPLRSENRPDCENQIDIVVPPTTAGQRQGDRRFLRLIGSDGDSASLRQAGRSSFRWNDTIRREVNTIAKSTDRRPALLDEDSRSPHSDLVMPVAFAKFEADWSKHDTGRPQVGYTVIKYENRRGSPRAVHRRHGDGAHGNVLGTAGNAGGRAATAVQCRGLCPSVLDSHPCGRRPWQDVWAVRPSTAVPSGTPTTPQAEFPAHIEASCHS